jgi:uncharacterized protein YecT (DUF1311 family)
LTEVEAQLPAVLADAKKVFSPSLVDADQKAWLAYRKAHCQDVASYYEGGSIVPLIFGDCERNLTIERITSLRGEIADLPR